MKLWIAPCFRSRRAVSDGGLLLSVAYDSTCLVTFFDFYGCMHACMDAWRHAWMHGCMDECMDACMLAWMHGCMDGCIDTRIYMNQGVGGLA